MDPHNIDNMDLFEIAEKTPERPHSRVVRVAETVSGLSGTNKATTSIQREVKKMCKQKATSSFAENGAPIEQKQPTKRSYNQKSTNEVASTESTSKTSTKTPKTNVQPKIREKKKNRLFKILRHVRGPAGTFLFYARDPDGAEQFYNYATALAKFRRIVKAYCKKVPGMAEETAKYDLNGGVSL